VEGYPGIAGLFRDTADGQTGHGHGYLDYLKKVGEPATDLPIGDRRISSVQYIKFKLSPKQVSAWSRGAKIVIDHPHYQAERPLTQAELSELSHDFA
jgi:hypothetical protein